jgi:hypothetical protein
MIGSLQTITLFAEPPESRSDPFSLLLSILLHGAVSGLMLYVLIHSPQITTQALRERYSVRLLEMYAAKPEPRNLNDGAYWPLPIPVSSSVASVATRSDHFQVPRLSALQLPAPHILVQPDTPSNVTLPQNVAIPLVVLVSPANLPTQKIVPPASPKPTHADVQPVLELPNGEKVVSEIALSAAPLNPTAASTIASTTTPIRIPGPKQENSLPQTSSDSQAPAAPATVMAISDLRMSEGTVVLPRASQAPSSNASSAAGLVRSEESHAAAGMDPGTSEFHDGTGQSISVKRIVLPKDGKFSMVLVGNSLEEQYPETAGIWTGRLAYTVYLHVGLAKSWILQYSLPRADQAAGTGSGARLESPWPTEIFVPNLPAGYTNSDALVAHGLLNKEGRFDKLAVVFPPEFQEARFILDLLKQWVFRPARQNEKTTDVEILLIIPEQDQ